MSNLKSISQLTQTRFITLPQVAEITTLGKTSIYKLISEVEILDWVEKKLAGREGNQ